MRSETEIKNEERLNAWHDSMSRFCVSADNLFDNKILYIGGGAIALSLTYWTKNSSPIVVFHTGPIIGVLLMCAAVLLHLTSPIIMKSYTHYFIKKIHEYRKSDVLVFPNDKKRPDVDRQEKGLYNCNFWLSVISLFLLWTGVIITMICIFINN